MSILSLDECWNWYQFQRALIGEEKARVIDAIRAAVALENPRYFGKSQDELDEEFTFQAFELSQLAMLGMLACTEAALRVDFEIRVKNRKKDPLSRRFRTITRRRKDKIRLEEDLLDQWRQEGVARMNNAVGEFKGALLWRHWLAHGRYWKPKLGRAAGYNPADVYDICKELLEAVDLMP